MGFLNDLVNVGSLGLVPDITGEDAAADAAAQANAGSNAAIAEKRRQFDLTRADLLPFLQAATGDGGALNQLIAGIDQSPETPTLQDFDFDPTEALNNPAFQFMRQQGEQQLDRLSAKNRRLGSGQRILGGVEFGQGLATQGLNDEFGRQLTMNNQTNNRLLQQHALGLDQFNSRLNRLAGIVDVGRGTGTALGQLGGESSGQIAQLLQGIGNNNAASTLAGNAGINNLVGQGIGALGLMAGGGFGGAAGGVPSFSPANMNIGFNPSGF